MSRRKPGSDANARRQYAQMRDRLVRNARRKVGTSISILMMLCRRWGDGKSRRAAGAFARSIRSERPQPRRWNLDRILVALTSGASDIDASARRLAGALRDLASDLDELNAMAWLLERPTP